MAAGCRMSALLDTAGRGEAGARGRGGRAPRAGSGSRWRPTSPTATPTACAGSSASRVPLSEEERRARDGAAGRARPARGDACRGRGTARGGRRAAWRDRDGARGLRGAAGPSSIPTRSRVPARSSASTASGGLRIERGYVRPEDEPRRAGDGDPAGEARRPRIVGTMPIPTTSTVAPVRRSGRAEEDDGLRPLSDRLDDRADGASHARSARRARPTIPTWPSSRRCTRSACRLFYRYGLDTCLEIEPQERRFRRPGAGPRRHRLAPGRSTRGIESWAAALPKAPGELWDALAAFDGDSRDALFAHCVALTVNAVTRPTTAGRARSPMPTARRGGRARHGGGRLAADGRELSRPRHQGAHPRGGARGQGRARRRPHRRS